MASRKIGKLSLRKKKNEEEIKEHEYVPETETEDETEEEAEAEIDEDSSYSDVDDLTVDTQPFIKPTKKSKKTVSKPNSLEKINKPSRKVVKRNLNDMVSPSTTNPDAETNFKKAKFDSIKEKEKDGKLVSNHSISSKDGEGRRKYALFNDHNVDVNLHNEAPQNIKVKKIKMSQSLMILCQMIEGADMKGNFNNDFAAMTFQKKMKDGKAYEFSIPLSLAPTLQNAAQVMIDANPQFFSGIKKFRE